VKFAKDKNKKNNPNKETMWCTRCKKDTHTTDKCFVLKREAKEKAQANSGNGHGKAQAQPYSRRTFRKEVNSMARRAGKHNGLDVMSKALKREQKKSTKHEKQLAAKKAAKKSEPDTDTSSDESVHCMDDPIPRKNRAKKRTPSPEPSDSDSSDDEEWKRRETKRFKRVEKDWRKKAAQHIRVLKPSDFSDTSEDEEDVEANKASAEETAFLKAIEKEEADMKEADNSD
jgi:hypothetical protein